MPRLNILALPSRTTLLFGLIVLVIFLPLLAAFGSGAPVCPPFILFWMILLPLRAFLAFLRRPQTTIQARGLVAAGARFPHVTATLQRLAREVVKIAPPSLLLST